MASLTLAPPDAIDELRKAQVDAVGWRGLAARGLDVVVDPMVYRSADVFLQGAEGVRRGKSTRSRDPDEVWPALSANIGSLAAFFDALVLNQKLPVFDYGVTFPDYHIFSGQHALADVCNEDGEVLVPVRVDHRVYDEVKAAAVEEMRHRPATLGRHAAAVLEELSAFDYEWRPDLSALRAQGDSSHDSVFDSFVFGGLLFGGYAQSMGGEHVLQPKRSRLYLETSMFGGTVGGGRPADALFARLKDISKEHPEALPRTVELPKAVTFLPYLLSSGDDDPRALIRRALKLRKSGVVKEFRAWRGALNTELLQGRLPGKYRKEFNALTAALKNELVSSTGETRLTLTVVGPELGGLDPKRIWGWTLRQLPGWRYRKLLMRLVLAQHEWVQLDTRVGQVWDT